MIDRRFLDWNEPALPALVRALVAEEARGDDLDLSGELVVLPGARPGRRLIELLVEAAEGAGLRMTPPRTVTVGGLPELLYEPGRPLAEPALARRVWAEALRAISPDRLDVLAPEPPEPGDLAGWAGLAGIVHGLAHEVAGEGHDFRSVAGACRRGLLFDDSERWELLARVREDYLRRLDELGRADPFRARMRALEEDRVGLPGEGPDAIRALHLVGVVEMPGVARRMLDRVAGSGVPTTAWIHAPPELDRRFDDAGCVITEAWTDADVVVPDEILAIRDDPAAQASEALRTLAAYDGAHAAEEITVGIPDEEVVPWIEQRFSAHGVRTRVAAGTPLERTGPVRLLRAVADYLDARRFTELAALLRHPALEDRLESRGVLESADRYHAEHLPGRVGEEMPTGRSTVEDGDAADLDALLDRLHGPDLLGPLASRERRRGRERLLSAWMPEVLALLARVYGDEPLRRGRPRERELVEACGRIREAAAELHRLPEGADRACGPAQAIRLLLGELAGPDVAVPPVADRSAVELLGWLELHLDDAPALVVTGFNEGKVPASVSAHSFLPNHLRSELDLVDNEERRARDAYLLAAILRSRQRVRIFAGRTTAAGDPLRPSRLLLTGEKEALARRVLRFTRGGGEAPPPIAPPEIRTPERSAFSAPPEEELVLPGPPEVFSVTEFRTLLQDPYRWILERRLDLEALHDEARELDPLAFGRLAHDVLEAFAAEAEVASNEAGAVARRLDRLLDWTVERRFGDGTLPAVPLQVEQLRRRLRAFARWHATRIEAGWRVVGTEVSTPEGGVPFDVDGEPVRLKGRIDRIDVHTGSGAVALFDYKTGDDPDDPERAHRTRGGEWRDLQLPLYRHILPHLHGPEGEPLVEAPDAREVRLGYLRIPKDAGGVGEALADWDEDTLEAALERARELIRQLRERPAARFEVDRVRSHRWDPLAPLLGRGALTLAPDEEEDGA